jgi:hypothetical protein
MKENNNNKMKQELNLDEVAKACTLTLLAILQDPFGIRLPVQAVKSIKEAMYKDMSEKNSIPNSAIEYDKLIGKHSA